MSREATVRILQATNLGNYVRDDLNMAKKEKAQEGHRISINSNTK